ncbi:MAG: aspartate aminotransferase family protein [Candidatus Woesearchaeota archaeon]
MKEDNFMLDTYARRELEIVRGEGVLLYDREGREYLDCMSNYGVNILGHNCAEINLAVRRQMQLITNLHCSFYNETRALAAEKLVEITPKRLTRVWFCNSGTEAVEASIKFAWAATGRRGIVAAKMGYHGKTVGALSATTSNPKYREDFLPLLPGFSTVSYNDAESLKSGVNSETAAVILEPIQGESGIRPATKEFLKTARDVCDDHGVLLIFDEVQTAFRTGRWTASEHYRVEPDIMCIAKGVAAGIPMGVTLTDEAVAEKIHKGAHTCTFGGNPLACAASLATIEYIEKHALLENSKEVGNYFMHGLQGVESNLIREVRGLGLMIGLDLKQKSSEYLKRLQDSGVIALPAGSTVVRFLPPLIFSKENVDTVMAKLKGALEYKKFK